MKFGFTLLISALIVLFFGFRYQEKSSEKELKTNNVRAFDNSNLPLSNNESFTIYQEFALSDLRFDFPNVPIVLKSFGDQPGDKCSMEGYSNYKNKGVESSYLKLFTQEFIRQVDLRDELSSNFETYLEKSEVLLALDYDWGGECSDKERYFFNKVLRSDVARDILFNFYLDYFEPKLDSIPKSTKEEYKIEIHNMMSFLNDYPIKKSGYLKIIENAKKYRDERMRYKYSEGFTDYLKRTNQWGQDWGDCDLISKIGVNNAWMVRRIEWDGFPIDAMMQYLKKGIEILDASESTFDCVYKYHLNNEIYIYDGVNATIFERDGKKLKVGMAPKVTCLKDGALNYYLIKTKDKEILIDAQLNIIDR